MNDNKKTNTTNFTYNNEYKQRIISVNRISKTVKGGRHMHFNALVAIGKDGEYGFAISKSNEVSDAIKKALEKAHRFIQKVTIVNNGTILHEVIGVYNATTVYLKPAVEGTGIIAGGSVRAILELSGFKNVISKIYGAKNSINAIRATHEAIKKLEMHKKLINLRRDMR